MSQSGAVRKPWEMVDVLILTALQDEYDALLEEDIDALPGSSWERRMGPLGLEVALRTFRGQGGGTLRVAVTRILEKGGVAPAYAAAPLVRAFSPRCLVGWEMEDFALPTLAYRQDTPYRLFVKGTMDWAQSAWVAKARAPAARLDAGGVMAFVRVHLPPMQLPVVQGQDRELQALLGSGSEERPQAPGPMALLNVRHAFVDFFEPIHAELLQDLRSWCDEEEAISVRLFHGAAGSGKTRLFIEAAQRLRNQGWRAGFLDEAVEPERFEALLAAASERPTLVVIDRAESFPQLGALLLSVAHRRKAGGPGRFRLVLISREAGGWWELLQRRSLELRKLLKERLPTEVAAITPSQRAAVFEHAANTFATRLGRALPPSASAPADTRFDRVLSLHMGALAVVRGKPFTPEAVREALLDEDVDPKQALLAGAWEPGPLGEALVLRALRREGVAAGEWMKRVVDGADPLATRSVFEVLGRLSAEAPEAGAWIASLLEGAVSTRALPALEAAKALGQRPAFAALGRELAKALEREGTPQVAEVLEAAGLPEFMATLREVSVWVKTTLLKHLPPGETPRDLIEQARFRGSLGLLLGALGRRQEAMGFVKEAVDLYRKLAEFSPEVFRADLALGLADLGVVQGELGQREEALSAMQEAVALRRVLAEESPREFLPILAVNLNGLAGAQSALGRRDEALASMQEAVSHYRALAKTRPESFLPELAASLNNLGSMQSALGRKAESQASIHEAAGHYRTLARKHPEPYLPELAGSLTNLAILQGEQGQREEALSLAQESVALFRQLIDARTEEHLPPFASSLTSLASALSALGRRDEALGAMLESVALRRKLAEARPKAFLADLAMSLVNLSVFQNELGLREESLATAKEASAHYRELTQAYSAAYLPALAICLNNLAAAQSALGRNAEALAPAQEAVEYYRRLAKMMPAMFVPRLAASLNTLASVQSSLELWKEAVASVQEGVEIRRKLAEEQPTAGLPELALSLNNLGTLLSGQGRKEEALGVLQESVDIRRQLAGEHPQAFRSDLAISLNNLGALQISLGRGAEALASVREAVSLRRLLADEHPEAFRSELAASIVTLGHVQKALGQESDAVASLFEALDLIWPYFLKLPTAFTAFTGNLMQELSTLQPRVGGEPPASWKERRETWNVMLEKAQARQMH